MEGIKEGVWLKKFPIEIEYIDKTFFVTSLITSRWPRIEFSTPKQNILNVTTTLYVKKYYQKKLTSSMFHVANNK